VASRCAGCSSVMRVGCLHVYFMSCTVWSLCVIWLSYGAWSLRGWFCLWSRREIVWAPQSHSSVLVGP